MRSGCYVTIQCECACALVGVLMGCGASKAAQVALSDQIRKGDVDLSNKELSSSERGEENGTQKERITQNGRDRVKENEGKSLDVTSRGEDGKHKGSW